MGGSDKISWENYKNYELLEIWKGYGQMSEHENKTKEESFECFATYIKFWIGIGGKKKKKIGTNIMNKSIK